VVGLGLGLRVYLHQYHLLPCPVLRRLPQSHRLDRMYHQVHPDLEGSLLQSV